MHDGRKGMYERERLIGVRFRDLKKILTKKLRESTGKSLNGKIREKRERERGGKKYKKNK